MTKEQIFINRKSTKIEFIIEPAAESFYLLAGQEAILKINYDEQSDDISIEIQDDAIVIFEEAGIGMEIFVEGVRKYYTNYSR